MKSIAKFALAAALVVPAAAQAQSAREVRRDVNEVHQDRHALDRTQAFGTRQDVREARQELREDRRERREDWQDFRRAHPDRFRFNSYAAPRGYAYRPYATGAILPAPYYGSRYWFNDYASYRLPRLGYAQRYVRYGGDLLLVNTRNGRIARVYRNFYG